MKILITGGASGLGEAITKRLAETAENTVYFTYSKSESNAKKIESEFLNTESIKCDFTNEVELEELKSKMLQIGIDVLINNAYNGGFLKSYFHKTPSTDFLLDFKHNILPTIEISKTAIDIFRKKKSGKLITILTSALLDAPPIGSSVYISDKAYLRQLAKVWATENSKFNITSNTISPSFLETSLTKDIDERMLEQIRENHPLKRLLTVEEVADTVYFLCIASTHVNGIDLVINSASNIK